MNRLGGWAFNILVAVSLLACITFSLLWWASYRDWGEFCSESHDYTDIRNQWANDYYVGSFRGSLYYLQRRWRTRDSIIEEAYVWRSRGYIYPRRSSNRMDPIPPPPHSTRWGFAFGGYALYDDPGERFTWLTVPCWFPVLATLILPGIIVARRLRRMRHRVAHRCPICSYDLRATPDRCPECGTVASGSAGAEKEHAAPEGGRR